MFFVLEYPFNISSRHCYWSYATPKLGSHLS